MTTHRDNKSMQNVNQEEYGYQDEIPCPYCGNRMKQGYLEIRVSRWGGVLASFAPVDVYFRPKESEEDISCLKRFHKRAALHCSSCDAVVSRGRNIP